MKLNSKQTIRSRVFSLWGISAVARIMNYDFCPNAKLLHYLKQPIGFVICAILASLSAGLFIGPQGFVMMWALIALLAIGGIWPWLSLRGLSCEVAFTEHRTFENSETIAQLEVTNRWPIPIYGLIVEEDFLQDVVDQDDLVASGLQRVPGWSVANFTWRLRPQRRGMLPPKPPELTSAFPFGILKSSREMSVSKSGMVWPECTALSGVPTLKGGCSISDGHLTDVSGFDGDTIGVRDFRDGESMRYVHWSKSAQMDRLIVKELQTNIQRNIRVEIDLSPETHFGTGSQSSYEWAIRVAASICRQVQLHQIGVELECMGLPSGHASVSTTRLGLEPLLDFLAMLPGLGLRAPGGNGGQCRKPFSSVGAQMGKQNILICTENSEMLGREGLNTKTVLITNEGFDQGLDYEFLTEIQKRNQSGSKLILTSPVSAAKQLEEGWQSAEFLKV